jgi:hypothetical protein
MPDRFDAYETREDLYAAYVRYLELGGIESSVGYVMAKGTAVYSPHVYRGGWVIRGFGYSTERVGKYVSADRAGIPEGV